MLFLSTIALLAGFLLDLILGDPQGWPHLVRFFGKVIAFLEKKLYPREDEGKKETRRRAGILLGFLVLTICTGLPALLLYGAWQLSPWLYFLLETLLCWQLLAVKSLKVESKKVYDALEANDLNRAREAVSMIVGRDTAKLDEVGVTKAAVETVAENASDGVAAPLFYLFFGGSVLGCFYKAVNTMDSMIGYKNERYLDFGRFAARLDDAVNFIPSRLCALTMIFAAGLTGMDWKNAWNIWRRDRKNHGSPNAAQTESAAAGALNIRLGGDAWYFGKRCKKPFIGDDIRPAEPKDILRTHKLLYATAILLMLTAFLLRGIILYATI